MAGIIKGTDEIPTILDQNKTNGVNEWESTAMLQSKEERILNATIQGFYEDKKQLDKYKKSTDEANKEIKQLFTKLNKQEFETDNGLIAKVTTQKRESFIEEKLIAKLKELNITTPIKTVEVIDFDELENVIYNEQLNASELTNCKTAKEVVTLKVTERKDK